MCAHALKSRSALAAIAAFCVLAAIGCAKVPLVGGKAAIQLSLEASDQCNTCGKQSAQPLEFAVIQVTDASAITGTSLVQIWGKEKALLGDALLTRDTGFIDPKAKQEFSYERNAKAKSVIVIGNFCKPEGTCWYVLQPLSKGSHLKLRAESSCLAVAKK
jgi:type VI secretion system VasD/TssJ family lipoprotein